MKAVAVILLLMLATPTGAAQPTSTATATGRLHLTFSQRSPLSEPAERLRRWREDSILHIPGNLWEDAKPAEQTKPAEGDAPQP